MRDARDAELSVVTSWQDLDKKNEGPRDIDPISFLINLSSRTDFLFNLEMLFLFLLNIKYNSSHSVVLLVIFLCVDRNYNEERTCSFLTVAQICPDWWLSNHSMFYLLIYNYTIRFHFLLVYLLQFRIIVAKDTVQPCDMWYVLRKQNMTY